MRLLFMLLLLLTSLAGADPAADARKAVQAAYDAYHQARASKDLKATMAFFDPQFRGLHPDGSATTYQGTQTLFERLYKSGATLQSSSHITGFRLVGNKAYATVQERWKTTIPAAWMSKASTRLFEDTAHDVWIRTPQGWRFLSSTNVAEKLTVDGKVKVRPESYVMVVRTDNKPSAMQTAITRFTGPGGQIVDLVGAVHIAEPAYYHELNKIFKGYDVVLYELIAPDLEERVIPTKGEKPDNALSALQVALKDMLGLSFQLEEVDYAARNFVHADLSPEELSSSMTRRGESVQSELMKLFKMSMKNAAQIDPADEAALNSALVSIIMNGPKPKQRAILRRVLAQSFQQVEKLMSDYEGPKGSSLISVRNQRALAVLKKQKGKKRVAIFYGAGHMGDMEARLKKMGYQKQSTRYLKAWDLRDPR